MTVVEFFDRAPIENMASCLTIKPHKVIFVGKNENATEQLKIYNRFLKKTGIKTELQFVSVEQNTIDAVYRELIRIVENNSDCVFDLTGGDDIILVAMGKVCEKYKGVKLHKFDIETGRVIDVDNDGFVPFKGTSQISVDENICLYGGSVSGGIRGRDAANHKALINAVWLVCKKNSVGWNQKVGNLIEFEKHKERNCGPLEIKLLYSTLSAEVAYFGEKRQNVAGLLRQLNNAGLIKDLSETRQMISYKYVNSFAKTCLAKAGNALELKTLVTAAGINDGGRPYYTDAVCGVEIDWDGKIHSRTDTEKDTQNEIDIMLTRGLVPVFISCKNGAVKEDELYKLNTVALRFGGIYAKKVLVAAGIPKEGDSLRFFKQRAEDMGITLIDDVRNLTDAEFSARLKL